MESALVGGRLDLEFRPLQCVQIPALIDLDHIHVAKFLNRHRNLLRRDLPFVRYVIFVRCGPLHRGALNPLIVQGLIRIHAIAYVLLVILHPFAFAAFALHHVRFRLWLRSFLNNLKRYLFRLTPRLP